MKPSPSARTLAQTTYIFVPFLTSALAALARAIAFLCSAAAWAFSLAVAALAFAFSTLSSALAIALASSASALASAFAIAAAFSAETAGAPEAAGAAVWLAADTVIENRPVIKRASSLFMSFSN